MAKITDARLAAYAAQLESLKTQTNRLDAQAKEIRGILLTELERRNTHLIESNGWRITRVQGTIVNTDFEALLHDLNIKQKKLVVRQVVDPKAVAAAVMAGQIDAATVDQHSTIQLKAPYTVITRVG